MSLYIIQELQLVDQWVQSKYLMKNIWNESELLFILTLANYHFMNIIIMISPKCICFRSAHECFCVHAVPRIIQTNNNNCQFDMENKTTVVDARFSYPLVHKRVSVGVDESSTWVTAISHGWPRYLSTCSRSLHFLHSNKITQAIYCIFIVLTVAGCGTRWNNGHDVVNYPLRVFQSCLPKT